MSAFKLVVGFVAIAIAGGTMAQPADPPLVKSMVKGYRGALVYIQVDKTDTKTGAVHTEGGTGFVVSNKGHVLTACHLVDQHIRDDQGVVLPIDVDKPVAHGAMGSRAPMKLEEMSILRCATDGIDLALLRFNDSSVTRPSTNVLIQSPDIGDDIAAMGFPLTTEFFARKGTLSGVNNDDTLLVDMTMNPGDSGAPVFDSKLRVVGTAEAGYGAATGIGIVRPIAHAAGLLITAGVNIYAVNLNIPATAASNQTGTSNVFITDQSAAIKNFVSSLKSAPPAQTAGQVRTVTYPLLQAFQSTSHPDLDSLAGPKVDVRSIQARPGYKIIDARFIGSAAAAANVLHVAPSASGDAVHAALEDKPVIGGAKPPVLSGFIQTTEVKFGIGP